MFELLDVKFSFLCRGSYKNAGGNDVVIYPGGELDIDIFSTDVYRSEAPQDFEITYILVAENMGNKTDKIVVDTRSIITGSGQLP